MTTHLEKKTLVGNAADEDQVKGAARKERDRRKQELLDLSSVLDTAPGRRFVWRYLSGCGVFQGGFIADAHRNYFCEGERNVGLKLLHDVNEAAPNAYLLMMKEARSKEYE